jgi:predicted homoserine dehydrogenase-like protein
MYEIDTRLREREAAGKPIRVGLIGAGQMGTEIVAQIGEMVGMDVAVIVDLSEDRARAGYANSKKRRDIMFAENLGKAEAATAAGKWVTATDHHLATRHSDIDVIVDATGSTRMGAEIAMDAVYNKKHVVMMNVECDITVGSFLRKMADDAGVVYSLAAGDEPAAIVELYRFANALGFEIVAAGKGKNNPLDIYATPESVREKADARKMSARMLCEFVDGSKTAVEMCAVSNATGLIPDVRGMHAAKATVPELTRVFVPKSDGGILDKSGIVDFAIGVHPGVFVVAKTDNQRIMDGMVQRDMGDGPYYTLYRPFHLCSVEVPLTIAQTVLYGESSGHPLFTPTSECLAIAKKDITAGETLDGIGEYCYRGSIDTARTAKEEDLLPLGLAMGCIARQDIPKDTVISYSMVDLVEETVLVQLRRLQDRLHS